MGNTWFAWLLGLPVGGAVIASLVLRFARRGVASSRARLEAIALSCAAGGIVIAMAVALAAVGRVVFFGAAFDVTPLTHIMLFVVNAALLCSLFITWGNREYAEKDTAVWSMPVTSALLAGAQLAEDGVISILWLLGAALVIVAAACAMPAFQRAEGHVATTGGVDTRLTQAKRITGGLKHLTSSVVGTGLLVVGVLLLSRYGLNLENKALLQLGVGLISVGLLVRAGAMPFASASSDLVDAAPGPATALFSALTPAVLLVGLMLLLPVERTLLAGNSTAWVGAVAVLLAGVRALGVHLPGRNTFPGNGEPPSLVPGELVSATIAVQVGWALTGLLLGSHSGAAGALLLAVNLSLAVPLMVVSARGLLESGSVLFKVGLAISVASLLGLPPLGGFAGTLLVAQGVTVLGGFWILLILFGSMLVAAKWLGLTRVWVGVGGQGSGVGDQGSGMRRYLRTDVVLVVVLVISQLGLLALSSLLADLVATLASPWLGP